MSHNNLPVAVIGSGAGGLPAAVELAERGIKVVLIERGSELDRNTIPTNTYSYELSSPWEERGHGNWNGPVRLNRGIGLGGSTLYYQCVARLPPLHAFKSWGLPIDKIQKISTEVKNFLQIAGEVQPSHSLNPVSKHLLDAARKNGWKSRAAPLAILSRPHAHRPACVRCGLCIYGCRVGDKGSADNTWLPRAKKTGLIDIHTNTTVEFLELQDERKVKSIRVHAGKEKYSIDVSAVIIAAGAFETPYLLKKSAQLYAPNGIGNVNVGRYLTGTLWQSLLCNLEGKTNSYSGPPVDMIIEEFEDENILLAQGRNFAGITGPLSAARFHQRYVSPTGVRSWMRDNYSSLAGLAAFAESSTSFDEGVITGKEREYRKTISDLDVTKLQDMNALLYKWASSSKAKVLLDLKHLTFASAMFRGTCRMGVNKKNSATHPTGRLRGYDNIYISDASVLGAGIISDPSLSLQVIGLYVGETVATSRNG